MRLRHNSLWITVFPRKQRGGARVWHNRSVTRRCGGVPGKPSMPLERTMHKPARAISADDYIRRIDRMLVVASGVVVGLSVALFI